MSQLRRRIGVRGFIYRRLRNLGLDPEVLAFNSFLAAGVNILVDIPPLPDGSIRGRRLLGAHYDGPDLHDNLGSVLSLLDLAAFLSRRKTRHAWRLAFWDAEERFQQGSRAYLGLSRTTNLSRTAKHPLNDEIYIDLDGLGVGPFLLARAVTESTWVSNGDEPEFLMDGQVFCSAGIPTFHVFSGPKDFADTYSRAGLAGCYREVQRRGLASPPSWRRALPFCRRGVTRLVTAWEDLSLDRAFFEAGALCPR